MSSRTQWEIAGVTLATVISAGTYGLGVTSSDDTVKQLEKSLSSYEKLDKINTEEFINSVVSTTSALELTIDERKRLRKQEIELVKLNKNLSVKDESIEKLQLSLNEQSKKTEELISTHKKSLEIKSQAYAKATTEKNLIIKQLTSELNDMKSDSFSFELAKGQGTNLKQGKYQVGISDISMGNECKVSVNNERKEMSAGDYVQSENCKITLTECDYFSSDPVKFEMVCFGDSKI
ncbi:hypothetical protein AB6D20_021195 [Vibrio splendidus]